MATNNRGRSGRNKKSDGRAQLSGVMRSENALATVAAVGGAVAAGIFLWSRRDRIRERIGGLSKSISSGGDGRSQVEIAEEALTLKETGNAA